MNKQKALARPSNWRVRFIQFIRDHFLAFRSGFRHIAIIPLATLMTIAAIGVCLSFPMSLFLLVKNVQHITHGWDPSSAITLYVKPTSTTHEVNLLLNKIKQYHFVEKTHYLTPKQALAEFQAASQLSDTLALLPENPLPGVISIQLNTQKTSQTTLMEMKADLAKQPQVSLAAFDYEWVDKLNTILAFTKGVSHFLYLIIGLGVILMVGNTIRLALERHRDEIEVLDLIGATQEFIRRPFLYRGVLYGSLGGMIAVLIMSSAVYYLRPKAEDLASLYQGMFVLDSLQFSDTLTFLTASACLGWLGAAFAFFQQRRTLTLKI